LFDGVLDYYLRTLQEPPKERPAPTIPGTNGGLNLPTNSTAPGQDSTQREGRVQNSGRVNALNEQSMNGQEMGEARPRPLASPNVSGLPPHVIETGNLLRANGIEITPRTMYVSQVLGPQAAVDLIKRTGSTSSDAVPSADRATGDQMREWVRALRLGPAAAGIAGGMAPAPATGPAAPDQLNLDTFDPTQSVA